MQTHTLQLATHEKRSGIIADFEFTHEIPGDIVAMVSDDRGQGIQVHTIHFIDNSTGLLTKGVWQQSVHEHVTGYDNTEKSAFITAFDRVR